MRKGDGNTPFDCSKFIFVTSKPQSLFVKPSQSTQRRRIAPSFFSANLCDSASPRQREKKDDINKQDNLRTLDAAFRTRSGRGVRTLVTEEAQRVKRTWRTFGEERQSD